MTSNDRSRKWVALGLLLVGGPGLFLVLTYQNCARLHPAGVTSASSTASTAAGTGPGNVDPGAGAGGSPSTGSGATSGGSSSSGGGSSSTPVSSANIIWNDEFDTFSLYDSIRKTGNWMGTNPGNSGGGPGWGAEYDVSPRDTNLGSSIYSVAGGMLTIRTDKTPSSLASKYNNMKYVSGALRTMNPSFGYAYYEMRAQLPKGSGMWPAFWLLPADGAWPPELDIVEGLANTPNTIWTTVHSTKSISGGQQVDSNHWQLGAAPVVGVNTQTGFHTYGCDFRGDNITWYFDGKQVFQTKTPSDLVNRKVYIILDTAVGGWNNNDVMSSMPFPAEFVIDYVRVYSQVP